MTTAPERRGTVSTITTARRVAQNVRAEASRRSMTQERLATVLGMSQQAISDRLRGRTPLTLDELDVLAAAFGMTVTELIDGSRSPDPAGPVSSPDAPLAQLAEQLTLNQRISPPLHYADRVVPLRRAA